MAVLRWPGACPGAQSRRLLTLSEAGAAERATSSTTPPRNGRRKPSASRAIGRTCRARPTVFGSRWRGVDSVELTDCPYGDTAYTYLYERYDEAGRFYVVRTPAYEDFSYTLVMRKTGKQVTVYGTPVWAQDKSRFLTVACSLLPERGTLTVHVPEGDGLRDGRRDRAAVRERKLLGALGPCLVDLGLVHAVGRGEQGQERHRVRPAARQGRVEEIRSLERITFIPIVESIDVFDCRTRIPRCARDDNIFVIQQVVSSERSDGSYSSTVNTYGGWY